jgi:hypothetical protein
MQHGHGALESRLHLRVATRRERDFAQVAVMGSGIGRSSETAYGESGK